MRKFKPVYLFKYDDELTINILANYIKKYLNTLERESDVLIAGNILTFIYNANTYGTDFDNYLNFEELQNLETYKTYDDGSIILATLLDIIEKIRSYDNQILESTVNNLTYIANYWIKKEEVINWIIDFMNYIAKVNKIKCNEEDFNINNEIILRRKIEYPYINYKI